MERGACGKALAASLQSPLKEARPPCGDACQSASEILQAGFVPPGSQPPDRDPGWEGKDRLVCVLGVGWGGSRVRFRS